MEERYKAIFHAGVISLVVNLVLGVSKAVVGIATNSIAILLDAINSLTDMCSSVVTLLGVKMAERPADEKHPFGYGRVEYLTSFTISAIILAAGLSSFVEAIKSLIHPSTPVYSMTSLVIVAFASVSKGLLGVYLKHMGKNAGSASLESTGVDAVMDGFVSLSTLIAAILYITLGLSVESWLAACIAILVIKNGIELLLDTISKVLGERADANVASKVERVVRSVKDVELASGLILQDVGPERLTGSIHITVDGDMTVTELDVVTREVQRRVYEDCGVLLTSVGAYPIARGDTDTREIRAKIGRIVWRHPQVVEMRGLYVDLQARRIRFDAFVDYGVKDRNSVGNDIAELCKEELPDWTIDMRVLPIVGD